MGMTTEEAWIGIYDAIECKAKANAPGACYHIYEQNRFLNYLLDSLPHDDVIEQLHA